MSFWSCSLLGLFISHSHTVHRVRAQKPQWDPGKGKERVEQCGIPKLEPVHYSLPAAALLPAQHCSSPKLGLSSATYLPEKGSNAHFSSRTCSGRSSDSISWHSSKVPCEPKVQSCICLILELPSIAPLVQLSPQPRRNATPELSFASCCPLQGQLGGQETPGVVISRVISH